MLSVLGLHSEAGYQNDTEVYCCSQKPIVTLFSHFVLIDKRLGRTCRDHGYQRIHFTCSECRIILADLRLDPTSSAECTYEFSQPGCRPLPSANRATLEVVPRPAFGLDDYCPMNWIECETTRLIYISTQPNLPGRCCSDRLSPLPILHWTNPNHLHGS